LLQKSRLTSTFRENPRRNTNILLKKRIVFILFLIHFLHSTSAQVLSRQAINKTAPGFSYRLESAQKDTLITVTIKANSLSAVYQCVNDQNSFTIVNSYQPLQLYVIKARISIIKNLLECNAVLFADDVKQPKEELLLGFVDYTVNGISLLQSKYPQYNGNGLNVSVKENRFDTLDIDFIGRILPSPFASNINSGHASAMATIIAGAGNTWNYTQGAAWGSHLSAASFSNLLPEPPSYYQQTPVHVQNHSYGTTIEQYYGAEAAAYDASVVTQPQLFHIFSAGNSGILTPATGVYTGLNGYANLTGNFKQAKNCISVGHIDSFYRVLAQSSKGPAFDGRIKPELVAFGEDGSSGAAALVSGITLSLQQTYLQLHGTIPTAALVKSVLLNSADDVGNPGIDFTSGFGNANGFKAIQTILKGRFFNGTVSSNAIQTFNISVPGGVQQLKLTLVWTDPSAAPNTNKALVNDLDLELENNGNGQKWQPWVLNAFPNADSLQKLPVRKKDTLNNTEQISINNPQSGNYTIRVNANALSTSNQLFAIAWQLDSTETFQWYYPSKEDHLLPPDSNVLRWQTTYTGIGTLQMSINSGTTWQTIDGDVDLSKGYFKYAPPAVYAKGLLRMQTGTSTFVSDTFTISKRVNTSVGFNCTDSVLINWQSIPGIQNYRVLRLGNQYLESFTTTADTFVVLSKTNNTSLHFAIEPVYQLKPLVRSYTFNYSTQGAGCYIRTLLADLNSGNTGLLQLQLSTSVRVKTIVFEKRKVNGFEEIHSTSANGFNLLYIHTDAQLNTGANIYRAAVILNDGRKIYSNETILYYNGNQKAVIYPNPVTRSQPLYVLAKPEDELRLQLINSNGAIIKEQLLNDVPELINIEHLSKAVYYYRILNKKGDKIQTGKVVVY
jgi:hypothetical protein